MQRLRRTLERIDHRGYKSYKDIQGSYSFGRFVLNVDHVQGDPFASPSRVSVRVDAGVFPGVLFGNKRRQVAFCDYITRCFSRAIPEVVRGRRGIGKSGEISIDAPGQEILERSSCVIESGELVVRFFMGLPARGRTVLAREATEMFFDEVPALVSMSMFPEGLDPWEMKKHVDCSEDQDFIRDRLRDLGLVAFIRDGSILPRMSGIDERPLDKGYVFESPTELSVEIGTLHHETIVGAGFPEGVTLVAGGGFHGKSTVLRALERGVYNHVPGDGREWVVTREDAVKIRSEDGRFVKNVDISPFISNLPGNRSTVEFSTDNASGSTSQAANIMEALELGSRLLLIDEDTSATNFMIRDDRMQALVSREKEPITPFIDRIRELYRDFSCSVILVMGGAGDYFDVADRVVMMDNYSMKDVTGLTRAIMERYPVSRAHEGDGRFGEIPRRVPAGFNPARGRKNVSIGARGRDRILFGTTEIDVGLVEQLVSDSQARCIAEIILCYARECARLSLEEGLGLIMERIVRNGIDSVLRPGCSDCALPRIFEVGAAINRMRSLEVER